jgi:hypothetical protein|tara:strand:- start:3810 stop:4253 length:444 start_codon:yes stop_codon:yes gene_type:complete
MKRLLPFSWHPKSWGKKGIDRDIAQAEYTINDAGKLLEEKTVIESKYDKEAATAAGEPWVNVLRMGIDPDNVVQGYFELDWNDEFVQMLNEAGIKGASDEDVVNTWFNAVCRTVLIQEKADQDYGFEQDNKGERPDVIRKTVSKSEK